MKANRKLTTIISLLLCLIIISCTLVLTLIFALGTTIFSQKFYLRLSSSEIYKGFVIDAIEEDISAQSSYVGIPAEILILGLDGQQLGTAMDDYMTRTSDYLNFRSTSVSPQYPSAVFLPALLSFLDKDAEVNEYIPTEQQYSLLREVASDTAGIIEKHLNLFQLDLFNEAPFFKLFHHRIFTLKENWPFIFGLWSAASLCLFMIHIRKLSRWINYQFTSLWIAAAIISVPTLIFTLFNLAGRLAIDTPYIQYAAEKFLGSFVNNLFIPGVVLLILSSIILLISFFHNNGNINSSV